MQARLFGEGRTGAGGGGGEPAAASAAQGGRAEGPPKREECAGRLRRALQPAPCGLLHSGGGQAENRAQAGGAGGFLQGGHGFGGGAGAGEEQTLRIKPQALKARGIRRAELFGSRPDKA